MKPFQFKLGLKKSPDDNRDLKFCTQPNKVLPIKYEIPIIRCIYTQQHNDCSANAICNQIMSLKDWNDNTYPSRLFQYWISRDVAGDTESDSGCTYRDAYKGLAKFGFTDELFFHIQKVFLKNHHKKHMIKQIKT